MINRKIITILVAVLAFSVGSFAQKSDVKNEEKQVKTPTVTEILKKYVIAQGGRKAVEKIKSRITRGTLTLSAVGVSGSMETFAVSDNKTATFIKLAGIGDMAEVIDGTTGWSSDPLNGIRESAGEQLTRQKFTSNFYREINLEKIYEKLEFIERSKVDDRETFVVKGTIKGLSSADMMYFDVETGQMLRFDTTTVSPEGTFPSSSFFSDFRKIDGVVLSYKIRSTTSQYEIVMEIKEIVQNTKIDAKVFAKPVQ